MHERVNQPRPQIRLEPWGEDDLALLVRINAPEMTEHLGGPETTQQVADRHRRYVDAAGSESVHVFRIMVDGVRAGQVAFWDREWRGEQVYEMGWSVLPEHQGRGVAGRATGAAIELARATGRRTAIHAFPSVDNGPSNGICRKLGFTLLGPVNFEYPKGCWSLSNDWRLTL
jgi:RimJ/RimL family protein N-acetyltransferase